MSMPPSGRQQRLEQRRGFTLLELLVVIAIIALLLSILLPSLGAARETARAIVCSSNLRQIAMAQNNYALDNADLIAGGPRSSGYDAHNGRFNGIAMQTWDFIGPLANAMDIQGPGDGLSESQLTEQVRAERFAWYRELPAFTCPSNDITASPWRSGAFTAGRMISYNMSTMFTNSAAVGVDPGADNRPNENDRRGYRARIDQVGTAHLKAIAFEGHRFATPELSQDQFPDFDSQIDASFGGAFGGVGAWWVDSKELNRAMAPGETTASFWRGRGAVDPRLYAFRHGPTPRGRYATETKGHLAFFDGHTEFMTDGEATNPDYWFPTNTLLKRSSSFWQYAQTAWPKKASDISSSDPYRVP